MDLGAPDAEPVPGLERDFPGEDNGSGAKAVYDAGGDTRAAFDRFNEDYPESDESSDFDDDYEDSDAPMDLLGDGSVVKRRTQAGQGWERPKDLCACVVEYAVVAGSASFGRAAAEKSRRADAKSTPPSKRAPIAESTFSRALDEPCDRDGAS